MQWNPEDYAKNSGAQLVWAKELKELIAKLHLQGHETLLDVGSCLTLRPQRSLVAL
jgi:trans-aconitate 2-methyltransferase